MSFTTRYKSHHTNKDDFPLIKVDEDTFLNKLNEKPKDNLRAVYVHTPYCDKICSFCNLNRELLNKDINLYVDYLVEQFNKYGKYKYFKEKGVDAIYFGGGTPTVYNVSQLEKILSTLRKNISFNNNYEFTFETTLHNLTYEKLKIMENYGVNRLSIGIQTFSDLGRRFYNRTYSQKEVIEKLKSLKNFFKGEICIDIIYNYPNQSYNDIINDAKIIKELDLGSSSFYSLMIHEGSNLSKDIKENKVKLSENLENELMLHNLFIKELTSDGEYQLLELTKIAKKNRDKYKYIKIRNSGGDTFPIGIGAGGNVHDIGIFRINKNMSVFFKKSERQINLEKVSNLFQFPKIDKKLVTSFLNEEKLKVFNKLMSKFEKENLIEIFTTLSKMEVI